MNNKQILSIAQKFRQNHKDSHPFMLERGYVRIYQEKPMAGVQSKKMQTRNALPP